MMKKWLLALALAVGATMSMTAIDAEAKRIGGGRSAGMQRATPAKPAESPPPTTAPNSNAAAPMAGAAPAAAAAATAGKRSWMGPLAGLAAGFGLAALFSHLGMGEGMADFMMLVLLAIVAVVAIRFLMRRFGAGRGAKAGGMKLAGATASAGSGAVSPPADTPFAPQAMPRSALATAPAGTELSAAGTPLPRAVAVPTLPEGFDREGFERIAKMLFVRMQAANDAGQVEDLRKFTTPELFASLRVDLQERGGAAQQTDVEKLDAVLVDSAQEDEQWIVSVRFTGLIRETAGAPAEPFDEVWHFVRPIDGSREWAIAGITQTA